MVKRYLTLMFFVVCDVLSVILSLGVSLTLNGESFYNIDNILNNITVGIDDITFKERAYPLLHFYYARKNSIPRF